MQRILAGSVNPSLRVHLRDQDGGSVAPSGTLTCTITRADGTVVAADRATTAGTGNQRLCALTTAEAQTLDVLKAVWEDDGVVRATTYHRVVGGFLYPLDELAQRAGIAEGFDQTQLLAERDRITDLIEGVIGVSFCPSYDLEERRAPGRCEIVTRRPLRSIRSLTIDGTAISTSSMYLDSGQGVIDARFTVYGWMTLGIEHGEDSAPRDLVDAALTASADNLMRRWNAKGPRVRSATNDLGVTEQFGYAGDRHPTGLDEVDAVIMRIADDYSDAAVA
jgi:hypothetical protein